jgi:hypothetical protein
MQEFKRRFTFITQIGNSAPEIPPSSKSEPAAAVSLPEKVDTVDRISKVFDHPSTQLVFGVLGGGVGSFLDGRYLAILAFLLNYAVIRTKVVADLSRNARVLVHVLTFSFFGTTFFLVGVSLNMKRPHTYTPADYESAVKNGTPLPIVQTINQIFPKETKVIEKTEAAHILFNPPQFLPNPENIPVVKLGYRNDGGQTVLHASFRGELKYGNSQDKCESTAFEEFRRKVVLSEEGPMIGSHSDGKFFTFTPTNVPSSNSDNLYLSAVVRWTSDGHKDIDTELFQYFSQQEQQWHSCGFHTGEHPVKKVKGKAK